jgi:outer membrane protein OmpA-like peptidoglycan-associated protein
MIATIRTLGLAALLVLCAFGGIARAADSCDAATELIHAAQARPLKGELANARHAVELCDSYASQLFLAHVLGANGQWQDAENAYREARSFAGADAELLSQVDMERALLLAAEPGRTCEAVAAFDDAAEARADRGLKPPPQWFTDRRRQVEGGWNKDGLSAGDIRCTLEARRSIVTRAMQETSEPGQKRRFCSEMSVSVPVQFDTDSAQLNGEGQRQVVALADAVRSLLRDDHLRLDGHTDETGAEPHNQVLSEHRASTVATEVARLLKLPPQQLRPVGHGSRQPKYPGHTAEDYRLNRRVELTLVPAECPL